MNQRQLLLLFSFFAISGSSYSQLVISKSTDIYINSGAIFYCNGGIAVDNSQLKNDGNLTITKLSTFSSAGTFAIYNSSAVSGSGTYSVEQDWINDANFNSNASTVRLFGNTEQKIMSTNGTDTEFNNLILSGTGSGINRRKTLVNCDVSIATTGKLELNNRELNTQNNIVTVKNPSASAVSNQSSYNNEGFVSSLVPGTFVRYTNSMLEYIFPVGSSDGTIRYRPVIIAPDQNSAQQFTVRFNNYSPDNISQSVLLKETDIENVNPLFFHSITQLNSGVANTLKIAYDANLDGIQSGIANWSNSTSLWSSLGTTNEMSLGNYLLQEKKSWDFSNKNESYALINIVENLIIPNVFTPNGDGINDLFDVKSKGLTEYTINIVNRWGEIVFQSNDINQHWDGKHNGNLCQDGTYFYFIRAKSKSKEFVEQGHLTLLSH